MRKLLLVSVMGCAFLLMPDVAAGDAVYHSQHIALHPVGGAPLHSGFVENIHPNGPQVYAHEVYVLNGADANATYQVVLLLYPFSPSCAGEPAVIPTAQLSTNGSGNGKAQVFFRPSDIGASLRDATHGIRWQVTTGGAAVYETDCSSVTLD
jgi:hypothetical protein